VPRGCAEERREERDDEHLSERVLTDHTVAEERIVEIRSVVEFDACSLASSEPEQKNRGR
jgi:hypothetical protein